MFVTLLPDTDNDNLMLYYIKINCNHCITNSLSNKNTYGLKKNNINIQFNLIRLLSGYMD